MPLVFPRPHFLNLSKIMYSNLAPKGSSMGAFCIYKKQYTITTIPHSIMFLGKKWDMSGIYPLVLRNLSANVILHMHSSKVANRSLGLKE